MRSLDGFGGLLGRIILEKGKVWFTGTQEDRLSLLYAQNKTKKKLCFKFSDDVWGKDSGTCLSHAHSGLRSTS